MPKQFIPKPGQIDFTHIKRVPVVNCVIRYKDKILLVKRSDDIHFYPGYWNGISGFLDDGRSIEEKLKAELNEEIGLKEADILSLVQGEPFEEEDLKYKKTWIIHPALLDVRTDRITLDWEAKECRWVDLKEVKDFQILPGFEKVLAALGLA